jgi:hypothetical protein
MKNFKLTKRRVAGLAIVLAIASLGIFAGTYAKYVSTVDLGNKPDQNAQVAVWHVGEPVSIGNLFSPYYYNASYSSDGSDLRNSGHGTYNSKEDTVFNNSGGDNPGNLIAPGTKGEKSFRIQDNVKSVEGSSVPVGTGNTEVSYIVTFPALEGEESRVTFEDDTDNYLKNHLKFKLSIDGTEKTADWVNGDGLNDALDDVEFRYDSSGLNAEVKIEWEWPFDNGNDTSDVAAAAAKTTVAVNFGTVRYEQVDNNTVPEAGDDYSFAGTTWRVLKVKGNKALILKVDALTAAEAGIDTDTNTTYADVPFLSETAVSKSGVSDAEGLDAGNTNGYHGYYYFDSDGSNGYEDSGSASYIGQDDLKYKYGLKGAIDYYYNYTIALTSDSDRVQAVKLNDPTFDKFKAVFDISATFNNWGWSSYYADKRFATTIGGSGSSKQAFALSYGDINSTDGAGENYFSLLNFTKNDPNYFWLRSAGYDNMNGSDIDTFGAGYVYENYFNCSIAVTFSLPVRPALWISLS